MPFVPSSLGHGPRDYSLQEGFEERKTNKCEVHAKGYNCFSYQSIQFEVWETGEEGRAEEVQSLLLQSSFAR